MLATTTILLHIRRFRLGSEAIFPQASPNAVCIALLGLDLTFFHDARTGQGTVVILWAGFVCTWIDMRWVPQSLCCSISCTKHRTLYTPRHKYILVLEKSDLQIPYYDSLPGASQYCVREQSLETDQTHPSETGTRRRRYWILELAGVCIDPRRMWTCDARERISNPFMNHAGRKSWRRLCTRLFEILDENILWFALSLRGSSRGCRKARKQD